MAIRSALQKKLNLTTTLGTSAAFRYGCFLSVFLLLSTTIDGAVTGEQRESFQRQGFLYIPDYFSSSPNELSLLKHLLRAGDDLLRLSASTAAGRTFSTLQAGVIFGFKEEVNSVGPDGQLENERAALQDIVLGFRNVVLRSSLVDTVVELLQLDPDSQNLRVLR